MRNIILTLTIISAATIALRAQKPTYDAQYIKLIREYTLHSDGSYDLHVRTELELMSHFAFHRLYGETFILYDPAYQEVKINEAYTIMADGTRVDLPENAVNELLPRFAVDAPVYNRTREIAITHTGLEVGATIYLDYTIQTPGDFMPFFMDAIRLRQEVPVKEMDVIVRVPEEIPLKYNAFRIRTSPTNFTERGKNVYQWSFRNLPPAPRRPFVPGDEEPYLAFTIARDMEWSFFRIVNQEAFRQVPGPVLSGRVDELVKKEEDEIMKMKELQSWVIDELNTVEVPDELNPFRARTSEEVWNSGYATPLEKAILLSDLLIKAGINAFPAYVFPAGYYDEQLGVPLLADRVMVQVNPKKYDRYYLSVEHKNDRNDLYTLGNEYIFPIDGARETLRAMTEKQVTSEMLMEGELTLDTTGTVTGTLNITLEGFANPYLALVSGKDELKKSLDGSISAGDVKEVDLHKLSELQSQATMKIKADKAVESYGEFLKLGLPGFRQGTGSFHFGYVSENREVPVAIPFLLNEIYEITIKLPDGYSLVNPPGEIEIRNDVAELLIVVAVKGNELVIRRSVEWLKDEVAVPEMDQFKEILKAWYEKDLSEIYLEKN